MSNEDQVRSEITFSFRRNLYIDKKYQIDSNGIIEKSEISKSHAHLFSGPPQFSTKGPLLFTVWN